MPSTRERALRSFAAELAAVFFFFALAAWCTRPLIAHFRTHVLAGGDPLVDLWTIHWLVRHFFDGQIFGGNTFYPAPHAVVYSDLTLGTAVWLVPFRHWLSDPVPLYNAAVLVTLAFAGWSFYRLGYELSGWRSAGWLTGTLAAFSPPQLNHLAHINLLAIGWLGLFLLGLHRLLRRPRIGAALLTGLSASLCAQSSGYYAVAAVVLGLLFAAFHHRFFRQAEWWRPAALALALALLLTAPYLRAYLQVRSVEGLRRPLGMSVQMAFHPSRDLTSIGYVDGWLLGSTGERLFPGFLMLALATAAWRRRAPHVAFLGSTAFALFVLSLGPSLRLGAWRVPLPYAGLVHVPTFESMRHPYTFAAVAIFLLAILAGLGWSRLAVARRPWATLLVVSLAIAEICAPPPGLQEIPPGLPDHYRALDALPPGPVLEIPLFSEEALVWAARHGRPVLNGQGSAFVPIDTLRLDRLIQNHWIRRRPENVDRSKPTRFLLAKFPVRYVIVPVGRMAEAAPLAEAFDRSRVFALVGQVADGTRIYEVHPEAAPAATSTDATPDNDEPPD